MKVNTSFAAQSNTAELVSYSQYVMRKIAAGLWRRRVGLAVPDVSKAPQPLDTTGSTHPTTQLRIPEDLNLQQHGSQNPNFANMLAVYQLHHTDMQFAFTANTSPLHWYLSKRSAK